MMTRKLINSNNLSNAAYMQCAIYNPRKSQMKINSFKKQKLDQAKNLRVPQLIFTWRVAGDCTYNPFIVDSGFGLRFGFNGKNEQFYSDSD